MYYYIYKITNQLNGKYYIGKHQHKSLNNSYLGSGIHLKRAIKKYGEENFSKEILLLADSREELIEMEKIAVSQIEVDDPQCYNLVLGGEGGDIKTQEQKKLHSERMSGKNNPCYGKIGENHPRYGKTHSEETKKKLSEKNSGENNPMYGKTAANRNSQIWDNYEVLKKYWIDFGKPGRHKFAKLLKENNIMDYPPSKYRRIINSFRKGVIIVKDH